MILTLSASGQTANFNQSPPPGFRWRVLAVVVSVQVGSGVGTRSITVFQNVLQNGGGPILATASGTAAIAATGGVAPTATTGNATEWSQFPVITNSDFLSIVATLLTGDSYSYWISIEEVLDE